ncbi:hypothetical protein MYSI104531_27375 [Mycobacterium simiae]
MGEIALVIGEVDAKRNKRGINPTTIQGRGLA